jgi:hypothetical protein
MSEEFTTIDESKAVAIFNGGLNDILAKIAEELRQNLPDISTEKGRKEIASRAYKASRCKSKLDEMGKELGDDARKKIEAINADRSRAKTFLENLRDEIRKPLDEYEEKEKARIADHEAAIATMESALSFADRASSSILHERMVSLDNFWRSRNWEEFAMRAENVARTTFDKLKIAHADSEKYEADQAELAKLRAEQEKRDAEEIERKRKEHETKIAEEAAERARQEEQQKAAEILQKSENARIKAEEEKLAAQKREEQANIDARNAAELAERLRVERAERFEEEKRFAIEKAAAEERKRQEDAAEEDRRQTAIREKDRAHRAEIHNAALKALVQLDCVLGEVPAKKIVEAIAKGLIPNVRIIY